MKSKKNLAATLAFLMTMQASGQPWAVLANEGEVDTPEPIIGESDTGTAAAETAPDPVIEEGETEAPQEAEETPADQEAPVDENQAPAAELEEEAPTETEAEKAEEKLPAFNDMSDAGTYTARVETINGDYDIKDVTVDLGTVAEKAPNMEAGYYYFRKATVNGQEITAVRSWKMEKDPGAKTYYQLKEGNGEPVELKEGERVVLVYEYVEPKKETEDSATKKETVKEAEAAENEQPEAEAAEPQNEYHQVQFFDQSVNAAGELVKNEKPIVTQWIKSGETAPTPAISCPEGYVFTGWSKDVNNPIDTETEFVAQYSKLENAITLQINYFYEGTQVMVEQPWIASVQPNTYAGTIEFPHVDGCETYVDGKKADSFTFEKPAQDTVVNVEYRGEETTYTVKHVFLKSDGSVNANKKAITEEKTGGINTPTAAEAKEFDGYTVQTINNVTIKGEGTVAEVRYAPKAYTITYQTGDGGSYVAPQSVYMDTLLPNVDEPTKLGYHFDGWEYSESIDANTPLMPATDVVAAAKWVANDTASYTVNYWQESLSGGYELAQKKDGTADVATGTGEVDTVIPYQAADNRYDGFHLNTEKSNGDVQITADGQAVKNVFYDRNEYSIKFYKKHKNNWAVNWVEDESLRITAKFGADISEEWKSKASAYRWTTSTNQNTGSGNVEWFTTMVNMPLNGDKAYYYEVEGNTHTINYFVEGLDGNNVLKQEVKTSSFSSLSEVDKVDIDGFTFNNWGDGRPHNNVASLYYTRNSYAIKFNNCASIPDVSVKFEAPIGQYLPKKATPPATEDSDSVFDGWYTAPVGGEKVDPNSTMPSHVLQVYAHWKKAEFTVSYVTNRDGVTFNSETLEKGSIIETPNVEAEDFLGWYTDANFEHAFVPGTQIGKDITLYAKWESDTQTTYSVKYVDEDGNVLKTVSDLGPVTVDTTSQVTADSLIEVNDKSYYPTETVKTLVASQKAEDNVVIFTCKPIQSWSYTVKYVDTDGEEIAATKTVSDVHNTLVQERAITISGYQLADDSIKTLSSSDHDKVVVFTYTKDETSYEVHYVGISEDGTEIVLKKTNHTAKLGAYVTAAEESFDDYEQITSDKDLSAAVKADGSTIIRVLYKHCEHSVSYTVADEFKDLYKGDLPETAKYRTGASVNVADDLTLEGYTFTGWEAKDVSVSGGTFTMPGTDVVFVGNFKRDLSTVSVNRISKQYDGEASSLEVTGTQPTDIVTFWTEDGTSELKNAFVNVKDSQKVLVKVRSTDGQDIVLRTEVTITPRELTITSMDAEKPYDGTALTKHGVIVSGDQFVKDEGAAYTFAGSQTIPGSSFNTFTYKLNEGTDKDNYVIETVMGTLKVTDRAEKYELTLEPNGNEVTYDGKNHEVSGFKETTFQLDNGETYTVSGLTAKAAGKDAGSYDVVIEGKAVVKDSAGQDVTDQFEVKTGTAKLIINQRVVTLTSATDSKDYDGTPLTRTEVTVSGDGFVAGEVAEEAAAATGSIVYPGETPNIIEINWEKGTNQENYKIEKHEGTLTVTDRAEKYELTLEPNGNEVTYDGKSHEVSGFKETTFQLDNGETYTVSGLTAKAAGKDAGSYDVVIEGKAVVKDSGGQDVTDQFEVKTGTAKLIINQRVVTLTSATDSKDYDGSPLTNDEVTIGGDGFADGEGVICKVTGSITRPGSVSNEFTYDLNEGTKEGNYVIETETGKLTVNSLNDDAKEVITITAESDTATYDGKEHSVSKLGGTAFEWNGHKYTVEGLSAVAAGTDAGIYDNKVMGTAQVLDEDEEDVTDQFTIKTVDGKLTIEKRKVDLTSASATKKYDGTALTAATVDESGEGFADGEGADYEVTGSILLPGTEKNSFTYVLHENTKADNYVITPVEGVLKITDRSEEDKEKDKVTIKADNGNAKYDGNIHTVSGVTGTEFIWNDLPYTIEGLSAHGEGLNAGTYPNVVTGTAQVLDKYGNDVTRQFTVETENGTLTISKRTMTLTSASDKKVYDGYALGNENVFLEGDEFVEGEKPAYVFGEDTKPMEAGTYTNDFTCQFERGVVTDNYEIKYVYGTLIIDAAEPTINVEADGTDITASGFAKKYDGQAVQVTASAANQEGKPIDGQFSYTVVNLNDSSDTYTTNEAPSFTNSGEWEVTATVANPNCEEKSVTVKVVIEKRNVLIKSEDQEWVYDGNAHSHEVAVHTGHEGYDGFVEGEEPEIHSFASITNSGQTDNTFSIRFNKRSGANVLSRMARIFGIASEDPDHIADNYNIEVQYGTLKVNKAGAENHGLAANVQDKTVTYNGQAQTLDPAVSNVKDALIEYSTDGKTWSTELPAYTHAGKYEILVRASHDNYEDAQATAVLTIVPAKLTVTTESAEKEYDGKPLTAPGTVTGLAEGDEVELTITGSQTEVGSSTNTYELKWTGADAADYEVEEVLGTLTVKEAPKKETPKNDDTPKKDTKTPSKVATALGLDPALWTSIMGAAGLGLVSAAKLSRKDRKKKDED